METKIFASVPTLSENQYPLFRVNLLNCDTASKAKDFPVHEYLTTGNTESDFSTPPRVGKKSLRLLTLERIVKWS